MRLLDLDDNDEHMRLLSRRSPQARKVVHGCNNLRLAKLDVESTVRDRRFEEALANIKCTALRNWSCRG